MNLHSNMNLPSNMGMDINNIGGSNIDNFDNVRGYSMTSNKFTSRTVLMFSSKTSVEYIIRIEHLNDKLNDNEVKDPINNSQLFYAELKEI